MRLIEFKCDCGIYHKLKFDNYLNFVGRDEKRKKWKKKR